MTGLAIPRYFTSADQHPFDAVAWEVRDVVIVGRDGQPVFEAHGVEFPAFWSQQATDIVASKYFRVVGGERETSVRQMIHRIVHEIGLWGYEDKYFQSWCVLGGDTGVFMDELTHILLNQYASFNSPAWFNVGVQKCPQTSACYVLDVEDSMESILEWYRQEGMIFKGGSGSGVNLSKIRAKGSSLSNGGVASGVISFARVADANAGAIRSGGSTRRAAKLLVLNVDHPEIEDFIQCKVDAERLARHLMKLGYGNGIEGGAYDQVPWQNANNSVSVSDEFMRDASCLIGLTSPEARSRQELLHKIAKAAWECGDPGLFFKDMVNAWHTTPHRGPIVSANPCGEFLRPPNEACNLASLNLLKFLNDDGSFDILAFTHTIDVLITAMDILIDRSSYPTEAIVANSKAYRPLGLGYCNLGALLMAKGLPYDSEEGRALAASITALMTGKAYSQSAKLANVKGAFSRFASNKDAMLDIIKRHIVDLYYIHEDAPCGKHDEVLSAMIITAHQSWCDVEGFGALYGFRNCQVTVLAPCGTISFMMDCDTTGIEPCLGLVTTKKLVGGGEMQMVNGVVDRGLKSLGFESVVFREQLREKLMYEMPEVLEPHIDVFATALGNNPIPWQGHIKMVAAVQPFISGGISKTINMPHDATVEDVRDAYIMAWKSGLKAISIYRDGSKGIQPVTVHAGTPMPMPHSESSLTLDASQWAQDYANMYGYKECAACAAKPGTPTLCPSCLHNRAVIDDFKKLWINSVQGQPTPRLLNPQLNLQRRHLPDERQSITHKFTINTHEGYLIVGLYPNGRPGELFVRMAKEGSTLGGLMDAWATVMSIALQYGVPPDVLTTKLKGTRYEPAGFTGNPDIHITSSITDYIAQWVEKKFSHMKPADFEDGGVMPSVVPGWEKTGCKPVVFGNPITDVVNFANNGQDVSSAPTCPECGAITARNGSCYVCSNCGATTGCS